MRLWTLSLVFALAAPARAQTPPEHISLADVIALARTESPAARALHAQIGIASARVDVASRFDNPTLSYSIYGRTRGTNQAINGTQHQAWIEQPLPLGHRRARRTAALADLDATSRDVDARLFALELEARRAFVTLLAAQARVTELERAAAQFEEVSAVVQGRAASGAQSQYDVLRIRLEAARVASRLGAARADVRVASSALGMLLGRAGWTPVAEGELASFATNADRAVLLDALVRTSPDVLAAEADVRAAEAEVARTRVERRPIIEAGIGGYFTTDGDSGSIYGQLSVPLPIFRTGRAEIAQARAELDAAVLQREAIEADRRARLEGARSVVAVRLEALERFDADVLAALPDLRTMASDAYRVGGRGVYELLDAYRITLDVVEARIDLLEALSLATTELEAASDPQRDPVGLP